MKYSSSVRCSFSASWCALLSTWFISSVAPVTSKMFFSWSRLSCGILRNPPGPFVGKRARIDAIAIVQHIGTQILDHNILLSPLFRLHVKSASHRDLAQRHDDQARRVGTRTARHTRHALATIPNRVAFQKLFQVSLAFARDDVDDVLRVVFVELRSRTNGSAHTAVHAGLQTFLYPIILIKFLN